MCSLFGKTVTPPPRVSFKLITKDLEMLWPQGGGIKKTTEAEAESPESPLSAYGRQKWNFEGHMLVFSWNICVYPRTILGQMRYSETSWNSCVYPKTILEQMKHSETENGSDYYHVIHKIACLRIKKTQPYCFTMLYKSQIIMVRENAHGLW